MAATLARRGYANVCTSIVVAAELRVGARKLDSKELTGNVDALLASLPVLSLDAGADHTYTEIRLQPEQAGIPMGPNDLLIAARAYAANSPHKLPSKHDPAARQVPGRQRIFVVWFVLSDGLEVTFGRPITVGP